MENSETKTDPFPEEVVRELEARNAVPKPRWHFLVNRSATWLLALLSVAIGGAAFAVAEYVFVDNDVIDKLQGSSIQDIAQSIPFLWLLLLALFTASAYYGFRRTRKGYKYATLTVVLVTVLLSIGLGLLLNQFDFGQYVRQQITDLSSPTATSSEAID